MRLWGPDSNERLVVGRGSGRRGVWLWRGDWWGSRLLFFSGLKSGGFSLWWGWEKKRRGDIRRFAVFGDLRLPGLFGDLLPYPLLVLV